MRALRGHDLRLALGLLRLLHHARPPVLHLLALDRLARAVARADVFYAGAGEPAFLESTYRDLGYKGVTSVVPGTFDDGVRGVRVEYDGERIGYAQLLQNFWRRCEPSAEETGGENEPVLYAMNAREMKMASEAVMMPTALIATNPSHFPRR